MYIMILYTHAESRKFWSNNAAFVHPSSLAKCSFDHLYAGPLLQSPCTVTLAHYCYPAQLPYTTDHQG